MKDSTLIKLARLGLLAALLALAPSPGRATGADAKPARPDLTGVVLSKDGQPLKDAGVFIYTTGPRVGPGFL